jgi:CheY-like chemotaxis protein
MARVLVLDDHNDMLEVVCEALEMLGYEALRGRSGLDGIAKLSEPNPLPSLIICDVTMPDMDGPTFVSHVRNHDRWADIPIIMMSGHDDRHLIDDMDAVEFIEKPFPIVVLDEVIQRLTAANRNWRSISH